MNEDLRHFLEISGGVFFLLSTAAVNTFVVVYGIWSKWWKVNERPNKPGRVMFGFMATVALIMDTAVIFGVWQGPDDVRVVIRLVLYGLLFGWLTRLVALLLQVQHQERNRRRAFLRRSERWNPTDTRDRSS